MTKAELIEKIAESTGISKASTVKVIAALVSGITEALKKDQKVSLVGFGTFAVSKKRARAGSTATRAGVKIAPTKRATFYPGKALRSLGRPGTDDPGPSIKAKRQSARK